MIQDYGNGIYGVDSLYEGEELAAVYIVLDEGRAAIVDTAHNGAIDPVMEGMAEVGVAADAVDYVCLTHVHLDHAGGAGRFMREFPNAKLVVHSRGARHMIDPAKLIEGVKAVYGAEETARMYGELLPVPADRVLVPEDGTELHLGSRTIVCLDTPGHAKHHLAFFDKRANAVFTGDIFGIAYPALATDGGFGVIPTTSPVQFDPETMRQSIDRIVALAPDKLYPTHFGEMRGIARIAADLRRQIDAYERLARDTQGDKDRIKEGLVRIFEAERTTQGWPIEPGKIAEVFRIDLELNAQGVACWYKSLKK